MLTFLKILIFGASVKMLSVPTYISSESLTIEIDKPLKVITTRAHLNVDITSNIVNRGLLEAREEASEKYPDNCVKATLHDQNNEKYIFSSAGFSWNQNQILLQLHSEIEITTKLEFMKISIISCEPIEQAKVIWKNHQKQPYKFAKFAAFVSLTVRDGDKKRRPLQRRYIFKES